MRDCAVCGRPFEPVQPNQLYCSKKCRKHQSFKKNYKPKPAITVACSGCGKEFKTHYRRPDQCYCSGNCQARTWRKNNRTKKRPPAPVTNCLTCGEWIEKRTLYTKRFCSQRCAGLDATWRKRGHLHYGVKVKWEAIPGLWLAGTVRSREGNTATVWAAGSVFEIADVKELIRV